MPTTEPGPPAGPGRDAATAAPPEARLAACRDAEDWFRELDVRYDARVLDVGRLHVLKLFGRELARLGPAPDLAGYRAALERAYAALVAGGPLEHRVFAVLRDHAPEQFVPLADVRSGTPPSTRTPSSTGGRDE